MATYKVIQDIEAEDKLIGPLSLRQFIYAGICIVFLYLAFLVVTSGLAIAAVIFLPPAAVFGFLAFPWSGEQPTEVWALAKVQFYVKPRKRIWNQSGVRELVTVTAPRKIEPIYTNGLSQVEVRSRLKALADTIDSRGWVIKNMPVGYGQQTGDRLLNVSAVPQPVTTFEAQGSEDMLDMQHNPVAQKFDSMIAASTKAHRDEIVARMNQAAEEPAPDAAPALQPPQQAPTAPQAPADNYWFLNKPSQVNTIVPQDTVTFNTQVVAPGTQSSSLPITAAAPTADEEAFIRQHSAESPLISPNMHGHLHVIQPLSAQGQAQPAPISQTAQPASNDVPSAGLQQSLPPTASAQPGAADGSAAPSATGQQPNPYVMYAPQTPQQPVTPAPDAAILDLARNDDLNVATIAREAQKRKEAPDEVVISLH